jgi:DNA polymerase III sliding clamp (beta) subunit (PCNA family)
MSQQISYHDLQRVLQAAFDKEMTIEYEKRERMVQRVIELERENQRFIQIMQQQQQTVNKKATTADAAV